MTSVVALRHVAFETLGILEDVFAQRKWKVTYIDVPTANLAKLDALKPDLVVILGGPIGANDERDYPFLTREIELIKQRIAAEKPTLGICLGAQLMARALGAKVYPGEVKEIGWSPLLLTANGQASAVKHLAAEHTFMFHWHGDTFDLPKGAVLLAGTETCLHQAFSFGAHALAFQCHPEVRLAELENWYVGHTLEIAATDATSVRQLRRDGLRFGPTLQKQGEACFTQWLDTLGLK